MPSELITIQKLKDQLLGDKHWTELKGQARIEYHKLCERERMALIQSSYEGVVIDPDLYKNQFVKE